VWILQIKLNKMRSNLFTVLLLFSLLFSACDLLDDSPCGLKQTFDIYLLGSSIVDTTTGQYYSYMDGNNRVFQYSELLENVCSQEHVGIEARVALLDENTTGINARCGGSWLFLFSSEFAMSKSGTDLKGNGSIGLKQQFGEDAAWIIPKLEIFFPTKGNYQADVKFLTDNVVSVELMAKYRKH